MYSVWFEPIRAGVRHGESKIRFGPDGVKFFVILLKVMTIFSPMRVFLPLSLAAFAIGGVYALWTILTQSHVTNSSVLLILLSVPIEGQQIAKGLVFLAVVWADSVLRHP